MKSEGTFGVWIYYTIGLLAESEDVLCSWSVLRRVGTDVRWNGLDRLAPACQDKDSEEGRGVTSMHGDDNDNDNEHEGGRSASPFPFPFPNRDKNNRHLISCMLYLVL